MQSSNFITRAHRHEKQNLHWLTSYVLDLEMLNVSFLFQRLNFFIFLPFPQQKSPTSSGFCGENQNCSQYSKLCTTLWIMAATVITIKFN